MQIFATRRYRTYAIAGLILFGILAAIGAWRIEIPSALLSTESIRSLVAQAGVWGPLVFIALHIGQTVIAPIPGQVTGIAAGLVFGLGLGFVYTMIGTIIGSAIAFGLARLFGRPVVERLLDDQVIERFDYLTERHGSVALVLMFTLPVFPDDALTMIAGLSSMRFPWFLVLVLIGRSPSYFTLNVVGAGIAAQQVYLVSSITAAVILLTVLVWQYRDTLERWIKRQR